MRERTAILIGVGLLMLIMGAVAIRMPCDDGFWSGFKLAAGAHCPTAEQRFGCSIAESNRNGWECD